MRATVLATVFVALTAAGVDARKHRRNCKPKHNGAVSAYSSSAAPAPTEVVVPVPASSSAAPEGAAPTSSDAPAPTDGGELLASAVPSSSAAPSGIATDAPAQEETPTSTVTEAPSSTDAPSSAEPTSTEAPWSEAPASSAPASEAPAPTEAPASSEAPASTVSAPATSETPAPNQNGESWPSVNQPSSTGPESMQKTILDLHNAVRAQYGSPALVWDQDLAEFAAGHADHCVFDHSASPPRTGGENISGNTQISLANLFDMWAEEEANYDWANPGFTGVGGSVVGHWTQIVWKETTKLGCAWKTCADGTILTGYGDSGFLVCEYFPAGNQISADAAETAAIFSANIGPKQ